MARTKRAAVRDPTDFPALRRSQRNRAAVRPPQGNREPATIDLEEEASSPPRSSSTISAPIETGVATSVPPVTTTETATAPPATTVTTTEPPTTVLSPNSHLDEVLVSDASDEEVIDRTAGEIPLFLGPDEETQQPSFDGWALVPYGFEFQSENSSPVIEILPNDTEEPLMRPETTYSFVGGITDYVGPHVEFDNVDFGGREDVMVNAPKTKKQKKGKQIPDLNMSAEGSTQDSPTDGESAKKAEKELRKKKGKSKLVDQSTEGPPKKKKKASKSVNRSGEGPSKTPTKRVTRSVGMSAAAVLQQGRPVQQPRKKTPKPKQASVRTSAPCERPDSEFGGLSCRLAFERFQKNKHKIALIDKGFDAQSIREFGFIRSVIDSQHLGSLCEIPEMCNMTLVKEFYAELAETPGQKLRVRGVKVVLSARRINRLFGLRPPKQTDFQKMLDNATEDTLLEVSAAVGIPDAVWDNHPSFMKRYFRGCDLKNDANVWVKFIKHSVNPTTHDSGLSVERMFLLYCLLQEKSINFGKIILGSLRYCSKLSRGRLYFPGMITKLMMNNGVPVYDDDEILKPVGRQWQIDLTTVSRLRDRRPGQIHESQATMLQNLLGQNRNLMDSMLQQNSEWQQKLDILSEKLQSEIERQKEKVKGLKLKVQVLEVDKSKIEAENVVLKELLRGAGSRGAGTSAAAPLQQETQPTPKE